MRKVLLIVLIFCQFAEVKAQNYVLGTTDVAGDATQPTSPDAKAIYHAQNMAGDSIFFKLEFYKRVDNVAWSAQIGLDTNNNVTDGAAWAGQNQSMKYDLLVSIFYNPGFPPPFTGNITNAASMYVSSNVSMSLADTNVLIVGLKRSEIESVAPLHYVAGTGIIAGLVNDDLPESAFITFSTGTGIISPGRQNFSVYPNPAGNYLHIDGLKNGAQYNYKIYNTEGRTILSGVLPNKHHIQLSGIGCGLYTLYVWSADEQVTMQVMKH